MIAKPVKGGGGGGDITRFLPICFLRSLVHI